MKALVFGNSGSGKSLFARNLAARTSAPVLDLDTVVWTQGTDPAFRRDGEIVAELQQFVETHPSWIIEGCYGRWVKHLLPFATELVFMNPGEATCLRNCRARPWEAHKYPTKEAQDAGLAFLLDWVRGYYSRSDDMSLQDHRQLFDAFAGKKTEITENEPEAS